MKQLPGAGKLKPAQSQNQFRVEQRKTPEEHRAKVGSVKIKLNVFTVAATTTIHAIPPPIANPETKIFAYKGDNE